MKKKLAFVVSAPGTAQSFLRDHFICLSKEYDVHLIANFIGDLDIREFENIGIVCHKVPICRQISVFRDIKSLMSLICVFRRTKFDSVHSVTPKAGLLTALAGKFARVPRRIHIFTGQVWATKSGLSRKFLRMMDRIIAVLDTDILVDGKSQCQFLIAEKVVSVEKCKVLANGSIAGVKMERFLVSGNIRFNERQKYNIHPEDTVYIFVGRLNHDKGIGELFDAFDKLAYERTDVKLVLYGRDEGGYDELITQGKYRNIHRNENYYYGGVTSKPFEALQVGDVYVIPTWREGFGMSIIEAQALELPAITSDAYGVLDAIENNITGIRCKVGDVGSLYNAMVFYYENPDVRKQHGVAGRKRVEQLYDNRLVSSAWMEFYHNIC